MALKTPPIFNDLCRRLSIYQKIKGALRTPNKALKKKIKKNTEILFYSKQYPYLCKVNMTEQRSIKTMVPQFIFKGISEIETCDCCGRQGLKRTVALENTQDGQISHYGVDCAAKAMRWTIGGQKTAQNNRAALQAFVNLEGRRYLEGLFDLYSHRGSASKLSDEQAAELISRIKERCAEKNLDFRVAITGWMGKLWIINSFFYFNYDPTWYTKLLSSLSK